VQNYAAADATAFSGFAKFTKFIPYAEIPVARLAAPKSVKKGRKATLDASRSYDPDGRIRDFAFDLDGNGSMEVDNGTKAVLKRKLSPGVHHVAVRVIDNQGLRAFANRTITVKG
jgi:hypothetical protein